MEISTAGKVQVAAKLECLEDLFRVEAGKLDSEKVRSIEVQDALIDTGAVMLSLPKSIVAQLGLRPFRTRRVRTVAGTIETKIFGAVRLTVQGRDCLTDVAEIPDDCPVLIGQIPLEALDFVVDPVGRRLIGNPEHGGEHMIDIL